MGYPLGEQTGRMAALDGLRSGLGGRQGWVCGERHLRQTQAYSVPYALTEDDGVGRGNIHTYAIRKKD